MIKIIELNSDEIIRLMADASEAFADRRRFRLAVEDTEVKWKVGEDMWTPGYGRLDPESGYAQRQLSYEVRRNTDFAVVSGRLSKSAAEAFCRAKNTPDAGGLYGVYDLEGNRAS